MSKRQVKATILRLIKQNGGMFLAALSEHRDLRRATAGELLDSLTELTVEEKLVEFLFRRPPEFRVDGIYFPGGTQINTKIRRSEMSLRAFSRPKNFEQLSGEEQWAIDKSLGILDWDGK